MRVCIAALLTLLLIFFSAFSNVSAMQKPTVRIKIATLSPKGSKIEKVLEAFRSAVKEKTDNAVDFKIYYSGVQGDDKDVLRKIQFRQLHGAILTGYGLGRIATPVRVTELPYTFRNYGEVDHVRKQMRPEMDEAIQNNGYVAIGWFDFGFCYNFSKVPLTGIDVARSQKWWVWEGDPLYEATFSVLDIKPVPLSFTDVMTSLSTKMIDAAATTPHSAVAFRWYTRFQYMAEFPVLNVLGATVVTQDVWKKISSGHQKIILELGEQYHREITMIQRKMNDESIASLKQAGIVIVRLDDTTAGSGWMHETARNTANVLVDKLYSKDLLDRTLALLKAYRASHPDSVVMNLK